jgi:uncharacterized repeat protein (TIGR01451 family)
LSTGYTFSSATPTSGTYNQATGVWNILGLLNGASETLQIVAVVNNIGNYTNTASISANQIDSVIANNLSSITPIPIVATADLKVVKTSSNLNPFVGETITFTIVVSNLGPSNATNVNVQDVLSDNYTFVSSTVSIGTYNNLTGFWEIGNMLNGSSETLTISVIVNP